MNSHVTKQLLATVPVTLLLFRASESPFASLSSSFVSAPTFRRPARLRPHLRLQFVMDRQLSGLRTDSPAGDVDSHNTIRANILTNKCIF